MPRKRLWQSLILAGALAVFAVVFTKLHDEQDSHVDAAAGTHAEVRPAEQTRAIVDPNEREGDLIVGNSDVGGSLSRAGYATSAAEEGAPHSNANAFDDGKSQDHGGASEDQPRDGSVRFRTSRSVQERCLTKPAPTADACALMGKYLEAFDREERDADWATRTESRIRDVVAARQDGTEIRSLECRRSLCAIEAESPGAEHLSIFRQSEQEAAGIIDDGNFVLAWEEDPAHGRLTITDVIFARRPLN